MNNIQHLIENPDFFCKRAMVEHGKPTYFTIIAATKCHKHLNKKFTLENDILVKKIPPFLNQYMARTIVGNLHTLYQILTTVTHPTIITGYATTKQSLYTILSLSTYKTQFANSKRPFIDKNNQDEINYATRTKDVFKPSHLLTIDIDAPSNNAPDIIKSLDSPEKIHSALCLIFPGFKDAGYVASYSCSSFIYRGLEKTPLSNTTSFHMYYMVDDPRDISRFIKMLEAKSWLKGFGYWVKNGSTDKELPKTIFDTIASSHERLCYESGAELGPGLMQRLPAPTYIKGARLNTSALKNLPQNELKAYCLLRKVPIDSRTAIDQDTALSYVKHKDNDLLWDTEIRLSEGERTITTPKKFKNSGVDKAPCFSPFRNEGHPSAFIGYNKKTDSVFVYDSATDTSHFLSTEPPTTDLKDLGTDYYIDRSQFPDIVLSEKGAVSKILQTQENFEHLLKEYNITAKYNLTSKLIETYIPGLLNKNGDNDSEIAINRIYSIANKNRFTINNIMMKGMLVDLADKNKYNPVYDWVTSRKWDGTPRIDELLKTIHCDSEKEVPYKNMIVYKWLLSSLTIGIGDGVKHEAVLVFSGPGGIGKTEWFKTLAPPHFLNDGVTLDPHSKDSVLNVIKYWMVEIGELDATFRKADIAALKAFFSRDRDEIRKPFASTSSRYPRRTAFFGSVNGEGFLKDDNGDRRYWALAVTLLDIYHKIDMQQLWAEVYDHLENGESYKLTPSQHKQMIKSAERHKSLNPIEELLDSAFLFNQKDIGLFTATDICKMIGVSPTAQNATKIGIALTRVFNKKVHRSSRTRKYNLPDLNPKFIP